MLDQLKLNKKKIVYHEILKLNQIINTKTLIYDN